MTDRQSDWTVCARWGDKGAEESEDYNHWRMQSLPFHFNWTFSTSFALDTKLGVCVCVCVCVGGWGVRTGGKKNHLILLTESGQNNWDIYAFWEEHKTHLWNLGTGWGGWVGGWINCIMDSPVTMEKVIKTNLYETRFVLLRGNHPPPHCAPSDTATVSICPLCCTLFGYY